MRISSKAHDSFRVFVRRVLAKYGIEPLEIGVATVPLHVGRRLEVLFQQENRAIRRLNQVRMLRIAHDGVFNDSSNRPIEVDKRARSLLYFELIA